MRYAVPVKPHPRIVNTVKWSAATILMLSILMWIASVWVSVAWHDGSDSSIGVDGGTLRIRIRSGGGVAMPNCVLQGAPDRGWEITSRQARWGWCFDRLIGGRLWYLDVPLWAPALMSAGAMAVPYLLNRRHKGGTARCPECDYDRTGLPAETLCPECGMLGT
jgi:hypothetical protein